MAGRGARRNCPRLLLERLDWSHVRRGVRARSLDAHRRNDKARQGCRAGFGYGYAHPGGAA